MADPRGPHARLDLAHGFGRGNPGGLVDEQNSIHERCADDSRYGGAA
jgi:hypothetical protein